MSEPEWSLPMNRTELIAELSQAKARVQELSDMRPATMRQALEQLTNGFKYSTEVVTIAREALGVTAETETERTESYDDMVLRKIEEMAASNPYIDPKDRFRVIEGAKDLFLGVTSKIK